ncbi:MAG: CaiB/BaiF CoA-transferase family protein [Rhodospirillaceae bacterium]|nr:CaiB/BaiF CoA-transferase family protein [Rhodospirillaceae bacterium]
MAGALDGIRVVDLSRVLAGPWATQILADLGAEVIKIEKPGAGDDTRGWGPPFAKDAQGHDEVAAYFLMANRNKKSIAIDLATNDGQDLVRKLIAQSDVVVENYKFGGLDKYGLDYAAIKKLHPGIVYCSITGFGHTGPYAHRPGYDLIAQAMSGLMSVTGNPAGTPGDEPMKVGVGVSDLFTGVYAAVGVLAALRHRDKTGQGQHVDLALLDTTIAMMSNMAQNYLVSGQVPSRIGNTHINIVPFGAFAVADGHIIVTVGNDGQFKRLCHVLGAPELADDPRFRTNELRVRHRAEANAALKPLFAKRHQAELLAALEAETVPVGPIYTVDQVFADPQVQARGVKVHTEPGAGIQADLVRNPIVLSETPVEHIKAPPHLGEHTREVLMRHLGLAPAAIDDLIKRGIVGARD